MGSLNQLQVVILMLAVVLVLMTVARRVLVPYPILLVLGGLALGFVPGLPLVTLEPNLVFLVFLPPMLWAAAYFTSFRDFWLNIRPIALLAVGLVFATTAAVAVAAHAVIPGMGWAAATALGAIVSAPDAIAATAIGRQLGIPRHLITILEGESLVNDAGALVIYRVAVGAMVTGQFSLAHATGGFLVAAVGGVAIGLAVGWLTRRALALTQDSFTEIAVSLLAPYVAWVAAERMQASAVLAAVAGGLYFRRYFSKVVAPVTRLQSRAVWDLLVFVLNGTIFVLIGLQLPSLAASAAPDSVGPLIVQGAIISAVAILARLALVFATTAVAHRFAPEADAREPWSHTLVIGWTGMRGIVTLAAAMALPYTDAAGRPLASREQIIIISFVTILATLVCQGLTLAPLIRRLGLKDDDALLHEEQRARRESASAAMERLDALSDQRWVQADDLEQLRHHYGQRLERYSRPVGSTSVFTVEARIANKRLRQAAIDAERARVISLRNRGIIGDEVLLRLEGELDLEAMRHGLGEIRSLPGAMLDSVAAGQRHLA